RAGVRVALPSMWGGQFGLDSSSPAVDRVVRAALDDPLVELTGLHFHRGTTIRSTDDVDGHIGDILAYADALYRRTGWWPSVLDVGGSLATPTVGAIPMVEFRLNRAFASDLLPPDPTSTAGLGQVSTMLRDAVDAHCQAGGLPAPRIVIEPGRAMTANTQMLLTTVLDVKRDGSITHAVLDAGINVAEPVQSEYHQLFSVTAPTAAATESYRLAGPICTPADVLYNNWRLPELRPGHVLAIMDAGAYFVPFSTSFSFPRPGIVMQDGGVVVPLRAAETMDDLVRHDVDLESTTAAVWERGGR
ncbi:MAG: pyridoxal-dependent decarboxylase, partial [Actinomycetota bacterium]